MATVTKISRSVDIKNNEVNYWLSRGENSICITVKQNLKGEYEYIIQLPLVDIVKKGQINGAYIDICVSKEFLGWLGSLINLIKEDEFINFKGLKDKTWNLGD